MAAGLAEKQRVQLSISKAKHENKIHSFVLNTVIFSQHKVCGMDTKQKELLSTQVCIIGTERRKRTHTLATHAVILPLA